MRRIHFVEQNHHLNHNNNNSAKKPKAFRASKFNVIAFSDVLFPWSDEGVHLTRESVMVCAQWVKQNLKVKSGPSYFLPSLMFALKDSQIDEVQSFVFPLRFSACALNQFFYHSSSYRILFFPEKLSESSCNVFESLRRLEENGKRQKSSDPCIVNSLAVLVDLLKTNVFYAVLERILVSCRSCL